MNIFGEFTKVEKQDDGTIIVEGIASTEAKDAQGEIVKADAMRAALPDYMQFGAVREMHKASAAGTAISAHVDDKGNTVLEALIVDPVAVQKVEKGVYKGFSIGGSYTGRDPMNKSIVTGVKLTEISLVDRPANPECRITLFKADGVAIEGDGAGDPAAAVAAPDPAAEAIQKAAVDELAKMLNDGEVTPLKVLDLVKRNFSAKERKKDAESGKAEPDGSFPIENEEDLKNAIKAVGRAKDPEAAKKHIKARAKALGLTKLLPDDWKDAKKAEAEGELKKFVGQEVWDATMAMDALRSIVILFQQEASEAENESEQLVMLKEVIERLKAFISSEIQETHEQDPLMALAAKAGDLAKAGARHGKVDREQMDTIHKALVGMGYECPGAAQKAEPVGDLAKLAGGDVSADTASAILRKLASDNADMAERLAKLEAQPAPAKGALRVVGKGQDVVAAEADPNEPDLSKMTEIERATYEMKKAHQNPHMVKLV